MGKQVSFTEENVKKNPFDYPKLKLAKGEIARLTFVESPWMEWVHSVQKPQLDERNNVLYKNMERKDGTEYQVPRLTFVSNPICLGDPEILKADGTDPVGCPACRRAVDGDKSFYPKRRYAMHVIRTDTEPRGSKALDPYSGRLLIWAFTDNLFGKIVGLHTEHGLATHDLILGPCEDATYQKAELSVAGGTAVDAAKRTAIFSDKNKAEDPTVFCGNRKTKARLEDDIRLVELEWEKSEKGDEDVVSSAAALNDGVAALLSEDKPAAKKDEWYREPEAVEPVTSFDDLSPEPAAEPVAIEPKKAAVKKTAPAPAPAASADSDFDDLFNNL